MKNIREQFGTADNLIEKCDEKVVYLSFDDGPGEHTERLLDILLAHDVKATFFVIGKGNEHLRSTIRREYEEGHTVAVHSLSHDYSRIYASEEAFWADFEAINDIIEEQTGHRSGLLRFPGGSSNTVSRRYNSGIMTRLARQAEEKGLQYIDWNVCPSDKVGTDNPDDVYKNIINDVSELTNQGCKVSIVLCHDSEKHTVDAMDHVLTWFEENNYILLPLKAGAADCHHTISN